VQLIDLPELRLQPTGAVSSQAARIVHTAGMHADDSAARSTDLARHHPHPDHNEPLGSWPASPEPNGATAATDRDGVPDPGSGLGSSCPRRTMTDLGSSRSEFGAYESLHRLLDRGRVPSRTAGWAVAEPVRTSRLIP
jgi:hypothetical protein